MKNIYESLSEFGRVDEYVPLSKMTTLHIGGLARYVAYPANDLSLDGMLKIIQKEGVPFKLIGKGSNLLCSDDLYEGVIIRLDKHFDDFYIRDTRIVAQSGCSIIMLAYKAMEQGLTGLEFASGIPGTVGGTTFMNAGAYRSSVSEIIEGVFVYREGRFEWMTSEECAFDYRTSIFQKHPDWIIVAVQYNLAKGDKKEIRELIDSRRARRMQSQPLEKRSAGSTFRNPDEMPAWKLIEGIGYRGKRIGDAAVSSKHVNFLINEDKATAKDFMKLVEEIQQEVKQKYDIELSMEVEKFNWEK